MSFLFFKEMIFCREIGKEMDKLGYFLICYGRVEDELNSIFLCVYLCVCRRVRIYWKFSIIYGCI